MPGASLGGSWFAEITEETTKLVSMTQLERLVEVFERCLVKLRKAALALARQRLHDFDRREVKEKEEGKEAKQKETKDREAKRLDERASHNT